MAKSTHGAHKYSGAPEYSGIPDLKYVVSSKPEMGAGRTVMASTCGACGKIEMPGDVCCSSSLDMSTKLKNC